MSRLRRDDVVSTGGFDHVAMLHSLAGGFGGPQSNEAVRDSRTREGRDLGTVVFPDAEVKLFLDADLDTRARRRYAELQHRGIPATLEAVR